MGCDTIYLNQISLSYLADKKIDGLIPNRKQTKEKIGKYLLNLKLAVYNSYHACNQLKCYIS